MKTPAHSNLLASAALFIATGCLCHCANASASSERTPEKYSMQDLRTINPRRYLETLGPNDRVWGEAAINRTSGRRRP